MNEKNAAGTPAHAWYVNMDGGRMFYGGKDQSFLVWPVRGESLLPATGQTLWIATANPALPSDHPFAQLRDVYWSSTTSLYEPDWAWALYMDKGAVGVGQKSQARLHVWPICEDHLLRS